MNAAAPAPNNAMLDGSGTAVPPDDPPDELIGDPPEELPPIGSFGGSFMACAGPAAAAPSITAKSAAVAAWRRALARIFNIGGMSPETANPIAALCDSAGFGISRVGPVP